MHASFRPSLVLTLTVWCALLFLIAPAFVVVPVSLTPQTYLSFPQDGLSLRHYATLVTDPAWLRSCLQSLLIAFLATGLATAVGTAAAIGATKIIGKAATVVHALALLPLIVPPVISALAFYRGWVAVGLFDTWTGTVLAHGILAIPYVFVTVSSSLSRLDPAYEMAARNLGASWSVAHLRVVLPILRPGILAGAVFAFVMSWDELVVTIFITSRSIFTLPRRMWDGIRENIDPTIAAVATVLILVSLLCLTLIRVARSDR